MQRLKRVLVPSESWGRIVVAAAALVLVILLSGLAGFPADYNRAQTSRAPLLAALLCPDRPPPLPCPGAAEIRDATRADNWFVVGYLVLGALAVLSLTSVRTWSATPSTPGPAAVTAVALLVGGGVCDLVENSRLHGSASRLVEGAPFADRPSIIAALGDLPQATVVFGALKWALLVASLALVTWTVFGPPGTDARPHAVYHRPKRDPDRPWDPPGTGEGDRVGICCSGGGIRSAAFSLGALQAFREQPAGCPLLARARYLAAVSGGGYLAAGLVVAEATARNHDPPVFSPGSVEERHFRDNSSYLVPDLWRGAVGVGRLLAGMLVNLLVVWLLLFALVRPVGWAIGELHPELQVGDRVALTRDPVPALRVVDVALVGGAPSGNALYEVLLAPARVPEGGPAARDEDTPSVLLDTAPFDPLDANAECSYTVTNERLSADGARTTVFDPRRSPGEDAAATARRALVSVSAGKATVARQPVVEVLAPGATAPGSDRCIALAVTLEIEAQPELGLRSNAVGALPGDLLAELRVERQPRVTSATGLRGRDDIEVDGWMWRATAATAAVALAFGLTLVTLRPSGRFGMPVTPPAGSGYLHRIVTRALLRRTWLLWPAVGAAIASLGLFLLCIGLPLLVQELPGWLESASVGLDRALGSAGSGLQDYLLPGGGVVFLAVTALRRYLTGAPDTDDGRKRADAPGRLRRAWRWLSGRSKQLAWYELSPAKILLGLLLAVSLVVLVVLSLQYASANGPGGRLMGVAVVRDKLGYGWWRPDWQRYLLVLVGLVAFERLVDAHAWSLQPFYKRRLSSAFLEGRRQTESGYDDGPMDFVRAQPPLDRFPQLVVGCAVNLSEVGRVPPGRRAAAFTFSSTEIGGPLVGYVPTVDYWAAMRRARQKDITVPGAMAISGAAFSPAMGKFNLGPVGSIMALANLRLGVWLPHPQYVAASAPRSWIHRPGWSWFVRELLNRYHFDEPYLYVSDGGHWENLGLVELLRRGCTQIVCVNAGGDSQASFGTIGEAVALAREEVDVEFFDFDPTSLRPPLAPSGSGRQLRRAEARDKAEPLATSSYVTGRFRYRKSGREGRIWLIEPALTADLPVDVHVFAEAEAIFPDDSTADQVFNHRQFEAFRALGHHQATKLTGDALLGAGPDRSGVTPHRPDDVE